LIVIDTHLAVCLLLPGNADQRADELLVRDSRWVVPGLFFSEFKSVLSGLLRQGAINLNDAIAYVNEAETVLERVPFSPNHGRILELSLGSGCPSYACEFVGLAEMLEVPLVTVDPKVLQAFPRLAMSPCAYVNQSATR